VLQPNRVVIKFTALKPLSHSAALQGNVFDQEKASGQSKCVNNCNQLIDMIAIHDVILHFIKFKTLHKAVIELLPNVASIRQVELSIRISTHGATHSNLEVNGLPVVFACHAVVL